MITYSDDGSPGVTVIDCDDSGTATTWQSDWNNRTAYITCAVMYVEIEEEIETENPCYFIQEERKYLKYLWLETLRQKQRILQPCSVSRGYCRRIMVSISGWIARVGHRKKRN